MVDELDELRHFTHTGYLSNMMHEKQQVGDVVQVSHARGDFYFDEENEDRDSPIVLISAGVGLTCLNSVLNSTLEHSASTSVA